MNRKEKFRYMVYGGLLIIAGIFVWTCALLCVSPLIGQISIEPSDDRLGKITCTELEVVDETGAVMVRMASSDEGGAFAVLDKQGHQRVTMGLWGDAGGIVVNDKQERHRVSIGMLPLRAFGETVPVAGVSVSDETGLGKRLFADGIRSVKSLEER